MLPTLCQDNSGYMQWFSDQKRSFQTLARHQNLGMGRTASPSRSVDASFTSTKSRLRTMRNSCAVVIRNSHDAADRPFFVAGPPAFLFSWGLSCFYNCLVSMINLGVLPKFELEQCDGLNNVCLNLAHCYTPVSTCQCIVQLGSYFGLGFASACFSFDPVLWTQRFASKKSQR